MTDAESRAERTIERSFEPDAGEPTAASGRFEPCASFESDASEPSPVCAACGWLEEEHTAAGGQVAPLRRRVTLPERRAS